ncbi:nitrous oxide reductase accessory protein NosL [Sulfurospirillum oryzae]|uniref:nitrous oxide reductase accessory protein NosL n=1 Tax=Sulfurospirillum oryzae TaxID=2976535 RepID=UPI0021E89179|nr:nitrous oxide reductase accessory protein NosL [Sulfurospirillum oryzae]
MKNKVLIWVLILFPIIVLSGFFWTLHVKQQLPTDISNSDKKALEFKDNTIQCPQCHMYLASAKYTAQIITQDSKTHFFDDVGCAILWLKEQKTEPQSITFWIFSNDTHHYIDAFKAFYSINDITPMHYGFGAYEQEKEGFIDFTEMRLRMLRGENMSDLKIRKKLIGH